MTVRKMTAYKTTVHKRGLSNINEIAIKMIPFKMTLR